MGNIKPKGFKIVCNIANCFYFKTVKKAEEEYNEFNKTQKIVSDFDKEINLLLGPDSD